MIKNSDECWHILIRLPDGMLFDGGIGVHDEKDIKEYDLELLEKYSYGLNRNYPRYCPEFSIEKVDSIIVEHLGRISQRDWS